MVIPLVLQNKDKKDKNNDRSYLSKTLRVNYIIKHHTMNSPVKPQASNHMVMVISQQILPS